MSRLKAGTPAAVRRAVGRWSHERLLQALRLVLEAQGELSLQALAQRLKVSPRRIVELTHYVLGPDPALGLQGHAFTPIFSGGPHGIRLRAGEGLARALPRLACVSATEAGLALAGLRTLAGEGPASRRATLHALADRLARTEAAQAAAAGAALGLADAGSALRQRLEAAVAEGRSLRFRYRAASGTRARTVRPHAVFIGPDGETPYLEAWQDGPGAGVRRFHLGRILAGSVQEGAPAAPFSAAELATLNADRMNSAFEAAFEPTLVLARGRAALALAQGTLRAQAWPTHPTVKAPRGWQAFALRYAQLPALVAALRGWIPDVRVAHPAPAVAAWKAEVAAIRQQR